MSLEESIAGEKLNQDASYAPDITGKTPSETKDDLGSPIVPGTHDARVILVVKGGRTEIDETNISIQEYPSSPPLALSQGG